MADLGFPVGADAGRGGTPTLNFVKFSDKITMVLILHFAHRGQKYFSWESDGFYFEWITTLGILRCIPVFLHT